jgi:hypothetical protein
MWQDREIWRNHKDQIIPLKAIKYCRVGSGDHESLYNFKILRNSSKTKTYPNNSNLLHGRHVTGTFAFQLAMVMGCNPIVLLGIDCCYRNNKTNFWGVNKRHNKNSLPKCADGLSYIMPRCSQIDIINCSLNNVIPNKISLPDFMNNRKDLFAPGREYLKSKLIK